MNPLAGRLRWMFQKNQHFIDSLILRRAPSFVYQARPEVPRDEITVFTFHIALPDWFEEQCRHLAENGYKTLSSSEFLHALASGGGAPPKSVLITFDDGLKHVWTVAYPLLKKYGLRATCFLIPGCIPEDDHRVRPTLEDVWEGHASEDDMIAFRADEPALATWDEIKVMHESGVIDFESHTMHHALVFTSDKVHDFLSPSYNTHFYGNVQVPLYQAKGQDVVSRDPLLGMPIYRGAPRMQAEARFFDDEALRDRCVEAVERAGGKRFFENGNWRSVLRGVVEDYRRNGAERTHYETLEERDKAVVDELRDSRRAIQTRLTGAEVKHLCFPWYEAKPFAVEAAQRAGFEAAYFGMLPGRPTNRPGQDPLAIVRVEDIFLQRLPGVGRKTLRDAFTQMVKLREMTPRIFPDRGREAG